MQRVVDLQSRQLASRSTGSIPPALDISQNEPNGRGRRLPARQTVAANEKHLVFLEDFATPCQFIGLARRGGLMARGLDVSAFCHCAPIPTLARCADKFVAIGDEGV